MHHTSQPRLMSHARPHQSVSLIDPSYPISLLPQRTILMGSHGHLYFNVFHHMCLCLCAGLFMYTLATSCGLHGVSSRFGQHSASQMRLCVHLTLTLDCRTASCGAAAHLAVPPLVRAPLLGALTMGSGLAWDVLSYRPVWGSPGERASSSVRCSGCVVSGMSSFSSSDSGGDNWNRQGVRGGHAWESSEMLFHVRTH